MFFQGMLTLPVSRSTTSPATISGKCIIKDVPQEYVLGLARLPPHSERPRPNVRRSPLEGSGTARSSPRRTLESAHRTGSSSILGAVELRKRGKICLPLISHLNDRLIGKPDAGIDMTFDFPQLIAHAAKTRRLGAGTIIGSGTVSNADRAAGSSCLAEVRMLETLATGAPTTPFMRFGDRVRIEMLDADGHSIFGAIEQEVVPAERPNEN